MEGLVRKNGQAFTPEDKDAERIFEKMAQGAHCKIEWIRTRNYDFHKKVFKFLTFCAEHWNCPDADLSDSAQFDRFRKDLTIAAGYYHTTYDLDGNVMVEAKSLSYDKMEQDEFEELHKALISAAIKFVFQELDPNSPEYSNIENQLLSFF